MWQCTLLVSHPMIPTQQCCGLHRLLGPSWFKICSLQHISWHKDPSSVQRLHLLPMGLVCFGLCGRWQMLNNDIHGFWVERGWNPALSDTLCPSGRIALDLFTIDERKSRALVMDLDKDSVRSMGLGNAPQLVEGRASLGSATALGQLHLCHWHGSALFSGSRLVSPCPQNTPILQ